MACGVCRICYRKRKVILILCTTVLFWVIYIILILPNDNSIKVSNLKQLEFRATTNVTRSFPKKKVINIQAPDILGKSIIKIDLFKHTVGDHVSLNISLKSKNDSAEIITTTSVPSGGLQIAKHLQNLKNNTINLGAKVKETLSDLGILTKRKFVKHITRPSVFHLNMTNAEYLHIIKTLVESETSRKSSSLPRGAQKVSPRTVPRAVNNSCACYDISCSCCVRLQISQLELKNIVCANLTSLTKTQELDIKFSLDRRVIYNESISAQYPPTICMGSAINSLEICSTFSNMTFRVNMHADHKTQLSGCIDFSLAVFNRTLSSFPLGCFSIPGEGQRPFQINDLGNWMP